MIHKLLFVTACLASFGYTLHAQEGTGLKHLCAISDEIVVVVITKEDWPAFGSLGRCVTYVNGVVAQRLKTTRFTNAVGPIQFIRVSTCAEPDLDFPTEKLLQIGKKYIVFLKSDAPGFDPLHNEKRYTLADDFLGVLPYDRYLADFIEEEQNAIRKKE